MTHEPDDYAALWEFAEFVAREAFLLRSFVEYLRAYPDSPQKMIRLENWRSEIGLQLGNPDVADTAAELFDKVRAAPPEARAEILRGALGMTQTAYFEHPPSSNT